VIAVIDSVDIRTFDLNLLRTLDALLDERSVTRAAVRLGLTQPAVSGALARLREALDDPLFVRTQHGVTPTPRALALAERVKQVLADAEVVLRPAPFEPAAWSGALAVAATDYAQRVIVTPFFADLRSVAPGLTLAVRALEPEHLAQRLEGGDLDIAVLALEYAPPSLHARRLLDDRYVLALRAGHPAAGQPMTLERFLGLEHALVSPAGGHFRGPVDVALEARSFARNVVASVPGFLPLVDLLLATDLVAAAPERLVRGAPGLATCDLPLEVPGFTMVCAWHARTHHDPAHRWLRERLAAHTAGGTATPA
jgi:DNA-binding transcriptional LysR family regulator